LLPIAEEYKPRAFCVHRFPVVSARYPSIPPPSAKELESIVEVIKSFCQIKTSSLSNGVGRPDFDAD